MNNASSSLCVLSAIQAFTGSPGSASTRSFPGTWKWNHSTRAALMSLHIFFLTGMDVIVSLCRFFFSFSKAWYAVLCLHKCCHNAWGWLKANARGGRVKNECRFECTNAAVCELCAIVCVCVWGGRPENVDLTPRAPAVFIPYSAEFNIEGLGAVKTYQSHDAYSWYNVLGRGTFFHVERCCGGNNITHAGWMSGKIRGVLLSNRTDGHFLFYHLVPVFFFVSFHISSSFNDTQLLSFQSIESGGQTFLSGLCAGK